MQRETKYMGKIGILIFIGVLIFVFILGLYGLGMFKFFGPKKENIRREIFEQTQSYIHGKIQDLASYKDQYEHAKDIDEKEAIRQVIINRFAEFDETKIKTQGLKNFLIQQRGY